MYIDICSIYIYNVYIYNVYIYIENVNMTFPYVHPLMESSHPYPGHPSALRLGRGGPGPRALRVDAQGVRGGAAWGVHGENMGKSTINGGF